MIRREVFEEVGGYDETFILSHSDIELCLRVREKGYRVVYVPYAKIKHRVGAPEANTIPQKIGSCGMNIVSPSSRREILILTPTFPISTQFLP